MQDILVCTADFDTSLVKNNHVWLLGEWCLTAKNISKLQTSEYNVIPHHWNDRQKYQKDYYYCKEIAKTICFDLAAFLKKKEDNNFTIEFYQNIIRHFIIYYTETIFDRYLSVINAKKFCNHVLIENHLPFSKGLKDSNEYINNIASDAYNSFIFCRIIQLIGGFEISTCKLQSRPKEYYNEKIINKIIRKIKNNEVIPTIKKIYKLLCRKFILKKNEVELCIFASYLNHNVEKKLASSVPTAFLTSPRDFKVSSTYDMRLRNALAKFLERQDYTDPFLKILGRLLPECLPTIYLEEFKNFLHKTLANAPRRSKIIFTSIGQEVSEHFKFYSAYQKEIYDSQVIINQHGGTYGIINWSSFYDHETMIADYYTSWGFSDKANVIPLPALKLQNLSLSPQKNGKIAWILTSCPRYNYRMVAFPTGPLFKEYISDQHLFFRSLTPKIQEQILCKPHPKDWGWGFKDGLMRSFPNMGFYIGSFSSCLNQSKLVVATYNATTFLESFVNNFPTIVYFNTKQWEICAKSQGYFNELNKLGIFHYTPDAAARFINNIDENLEEWWNQKDLQEYLQLFCKEYAYSSKDWQKEWQIFFQKIYQQPAKTKESLVQPCPSF